MKIKAVQISEPGRLEGLEIEYPEHPGPGQVLVRTHCVGICGTDISSFRGTFPFFEYPRIPGHELGVEVLEVGAGVNSVAVGDRCSVEPYLNCGKCLACRMGATNCCETLNVIGVMSDGGLCEQFLIPESKLHRSETLSFEELALVETLAIGCHAARRSEVSQGDRVLIIGAGPIGLSALEFVKLSGASISVMDIDEYRLDFCRNHYPIDAIILNRGDGSEDEEIQKATDGDRFSVVIDATGSHQSMSAALKYVSATGTLVYLGVTREAIVFPHPMLHKPEITIKGSRNAVAGDFRRCIEMIQSGQIDTKSWITRRIAMDEVVEQFERVARPGSTDLKAVICL